MQVDRAVLTNLLSFLNAASHTVYHVISKLSKKTYKQYEGYSQMQLISQILKKKLTIVKCGGFLGFGFF